MPALTLVQDDALYWYIDYQDIAVSDPRALGAFLRKHREALTPGPGEIGARALRRRTPGLRREELAQQAGTSLTWVTWLEQGRAVTASPATLARLADALQLKAAERTYLFELAGRHDPATPALAGDTPMPASLSAALAATAAPAYVLDHRWDARAWNPAACTLLRGWLDGPQRNLLRFVFLDPAARTLIDDWEVRAHRLVAECRATTASGSDEALQSLVASLQQASAFFAACWHDQRVLAREGGRRVFLREDGSRQAYEQLSLVAAASPSFTLVMLLPDATAK